MTLLEYQNYCTLEGINADIERDSLFDSDLREDSENFSHEMNHQIIESADSIGDMFSNYSY